MLIYPCRRLRAKGYQFILLKSRVLTPCLQKVQVKVIPPSQMVASCTPAVGANQAFNWTEAIETIMTE